MNVYIKWIFVCLLILNIFIFGMQFIEHGFPKKETKVINVEVSNDKLCKGPVQEGYNEKHFRKTCEHIKKEYDNKWELFKG